MDEKSLSPMPEGSLMYYKSQYEQLEQDLAEFQASSHQLEEELEKDVEAAEKRERVLKDKVEGLGYEVDEWKAKYKQAKIEASAAQSVLQKEITTLRESTRTLQLKLRDIEVENDDIERQARNTSSSLEDLESKYNMTLERAVMIEEEIKASELERENLRIENQRLRDELSDLKIEVEIMQDKLRKRLTPPTDAITVSNSEKQFSPETIISSSINSTPPVKKTMAATIPGNETPPSPPISETSGPVKSALKTPTNVPKSRLKAPSGDSSTTPKPVARYTSMDLRNSRGPAAPSSNFRIRNATPSVIRQTKAKAPATRGLPNSNSLTHIRSLTAQMQRLEKRVQSARSKLPAPVITPPRSSPRIGPSDSVIPSSVTMRTKKRMIGNTANTSNISTEDSPQSSSKGNSRLSSSGVSRLSFGASRSNASDKRSSSRISGSYSRSERPFSRSETNRPGSRASTSGARSSLGRYSNSQYSELQRLRLSLGSSHGSIPRSHGMSQSKSRVDSDEGRNHDHDLNTPSRRKTFGKSEEISAIPVFNGVSRRKSSHSITLSRRTSNGNILDSAMKPPNRSRKLSNLGETY